MQFGLTIFGLKTCPYYILMNEFDTENGFITPKEAKELLHITDKTLRIWADRVAARKGGR